MFLQYKQGSSRQGKGSAKYRVPDMAWVGLRPSQLDDLNLPEQARLPQVSTSSKSRRQFIGQLVADAVNSERRLLHDKSRIFIGSQQIVLAFSLMSNLLNSAQIAHVVVIIHGHLR